MTPEDKLIQALRYNMTVAYIEPFHGYWKYSINNSPPRDYSDFGDCYSDMLSVASEIDYDTESYKAMELWDWANELIQHPHYPTQRFTFKFFLIMGVLYKVVPEVGTPFEWSYITDEWDMADEQNNNQEITK